MLLSLLLLLVLVLFYFPASPEAKPFTFGGSGGAASGSGSGAFSFSGGGGGGIGAAVAAAGADGGGAAAADEVDATQDGEHTGATFEPVVKLTEFVEAAAEEDEAELLKVRCKLYRFDKDGAEWKERGLGDLRILRHKKRGVIRVLMRRDKTHKVCANHYIVPGMELTENVGSDKSWVYSANDFADGEPVAEVLAAKFPTKEVAAEFKAAFEKAREEMAAVKEKAEAEGGAEEGEAKAEAEEAKAEEGEAAKKDEEEAKA
jgi:Ran-binding protein 1